MYSLMLESHNDSAVAIAEHVAGSVENFAILMNKKAEEIGCMHTHFITPNGLDKEEDGKKHSTCAEDLAKIMSYCITKSPYKEQFIKITGTDSYQFSNKIVKEDGSVTDGERSFSCNNHNAFLHMMDGAFTGKTGFTGEAGYCYVGALKRDQRIFVVALLACGWPNHKTYKWSDTKKLMQYGIDNYIRYSFDTCKLDEEKLQPVLIQNGQTTRIGAKVYVKLERIKTEMPASVLLHKGEQVQIKYKLESNLAAPVSKWDKIGEIEYITGNTVWKTENLVLTESVPVIDFKWCLSKVLQMYFYNYEKDGIL